MAKVKSGSIVFGGYGAGGVVIDVILDNNEQWGFIGAMAPVVGLGGNLNIPLVAGDFPGYDYMAGGCMIEMAAASLALLPAGGLIINFHGFREIGWVTFGSAGINLAAAAGGGRWAIDPGARVTPST